MTSSELEYARALAPDEREFNDLVDGREDELVRERAETLLDHPLVLAGPGTAEDRARALAQVQLQQDDPELRARIRAEIIAETPEWEERLDPERLARQQIAERARRQTVFVDDVTPIAGDSGDLAECCGYMFVRGAVWFARWRLATRPGSGVLTLASLTVEPFDPPDASLTHTVLAAISVPKLIERGLEQLRVDARFINAFQHFGRPGLPSLEERARILSAARRAAVPVGRLGRKPMPDEQLEALAMQAVELGSRPRAKSQGVIPALARQYGRPPGTIRTWVKRARVRGFLPPENGVWALGPKFTPHKEDET